MESLCRRGPVAALDSQRHGEYGYSNGQQRGSVIRSLTHRHLWYRLVDHGVPKTDIDG